LIKIRNKRIALLLVLAMLATMFVGVGAASAATSENGNITISKSINKNIAEEDADDLGYVKIGVSATNAIAGSIVWEVTLPDDVYFLEEDGAQTDNGTVTTSAGTAVNAYILPLDQVWVDSAAPDDINVDVTITYLDTNDNEYDKFEGTLLLAQKGTQKTTVTAASPKSVALGIEKKIAKITFDEDLEGSMELGSEVALELPDGFKWSQTADPVITQGIYGLEFGDPTYSDDDMTMFFEVTGISVGAADKVKVVAYVTVYPDAPDGDVIVNVYENVADTHISSTDLTVAVVGAAEVTVTAEDTDATDDSVKRASQNAELWDITLETDSSFASGDDLLLKVPDGVEFMESVGDADFDGFINNGLYDDNQGLWLTVADDTTADLELSGETLKVGITPKAKTGDFVLTLSGDVVDATVVASKIVDRLTITADKPVVKVGLEQAAGNVTFKENQKDAFPNNYEIWAQLPDGVTFASTPTVKVGDNECDVTVGPDGYDNDVVQIELDGMKAGVPDTIIMSDVSLDVDTRYSSGKDIVLKVGGIDWEADDVNRLDGSDDAQFESKADDAVYSIAIATSKSAGSAVAVFTLGQNSYVKDGVSFAMDVAPFAQNGRTYVPVRFIANALNVPDQNIYWDAANQTVTLIKDNNVVQFKLGSTTRLINAIPATMDAAPIAQNGRVFLPARFVAEAFAAVVGWDAAAPNSVTITLD